MVISDFNDAQHWVVFSCTLCWRYMGIWCIVVWMMQVMELWGLFYKLRCYWWMWQNIELNSFLIVVFHIGSLFNIKVWQRLYYRVLSFMLVGNNALLPWTIFLFETMHFHYAISFKGRNVGLETNVRGQLRKMMKHYRGFKSKKLWQIYVRCLCNWEILKDIFGFHVHAFWEKVLAFLGPPKRKCGFYRWIWVW